MSLKRGFCSQSFTAHCLVLSPSHVCSHIERSTLPLPTDSRFWSFYEMHLTLYLFLIEHLFFRWVVFEHSSKIDKTVYQFSLLNFNFHVGLYWFLVDVHLFRFRTTYTQVKSTCHQVLICNPAPSSAIKTMSSAKSTSARFPFYVRK